MKYGMIAGLLAAIGALAFAGQSHAGNRYCSYYPEDPNCYQLLYGQGGAYQVLGDDYDDEELDGGDVNYQPSPPLRPVVRSAKSCEGVGRELRQFGYRHVRAVACGGRSYKYVAYLGYQRFMVKVNSHSGAIVYEINY
jgi:hypothetical protein